ncbi:MAG: hypothetical protein FD146_1416 [Anaerolineaceae bacterium]|nr:MAG: hypothetical protein FD146_1416 [Anaerolineaceae bacterium]
MPYRVVLTPEAQNDLHCLDAGIRKRLLDKLEWMGENAELLNHQALQGEDVIFSIRTISRRTPCKNSNT